MENNVISRIVKEPDPILRRPAKQVASVSPELTELIERMIRTMYAARGVGLAANQIGSDLAVLVASPEGTPGKEIVLVNPVIEQRKGRATLPEGCLSLPGISAEVSRAAAVTASGLDAKGNKVMIQAEGLLAKILQHETDHLNGQLFVDRLNLLKKFKLLQQYKSIAQTLRQVNL